MAEEQHALWMARYLDDDLSADERAWFGRHLRACAVCQAELALSESLFATLDSLEDVPAPATLAARVRARLAEPAAPRRAGLPWAVAAIAAALLLVMGLGAGLAGVTLSAPEQITPLLAPLAGLLAPPEALGARLGDLWASWSGLGVEFVPSALVLGLALVLLALGLVGNGWLLTRQRSAP